MAIIHHGMVEATVPHTGTYVTPRISEGSYRIARVRGTTANRILKPGRLLQVCLSQGEREKERERVSFGIARVRGTTANRILKPGRLLQVCLSQGERERERERE